MSNLLKRTLFIQAVSIASANKPVIQVSEIEYKSSGFITYITLGTTEVEFECDEITEEQFTAMKAEQLEQLKSEIMETAKKQCEALT